MMNGYECYSLHNSLKLHFNSEKFDFFKYQGKSRTTVNAFEKRRDKYLFHKLAKKYSDDEMLDFLVSNLTRKHSGWIGDLLDDSSDVIFKEHLKVKQSLGYIFQNECENLFEGSENPNDLLSTDGQYPKLLSKTMQGEIHVETLIILNDLLGFFSVWNKKITDNIRWPDFYLTCLKYRPFLVYNRDYFRNILKKTLNK